MTSKSQHSEPMVSQHTAEENQWFNERLFKTRTILLSGTVNDALARRLIQTVLILEADNPERHINIIINSGGGSVTSGFGIYDVLKYIKPQIRCISAGLTASIATIIMLAADKEHRYSLPNSRLLIHQPLIPFTMFGPASDLEITAQEIVKTRAKINEMLATECDQSLEKVVKDTARDYWMSAEEALEYGLVSKIIQNRADLGE
ncbi:MAG TPA: ATP-dependent Clp protease proteolytic subunit [Myxococcales bacterium]|nr:ATP-dependent Clp protease proteolytic subunit [Myxococcales bacterium]HIN85827.1 ATP-dependent Clp protease proteolytic subunit [Myxococcales bacterium]